MKKGFLVALLAGGLAAAAFGSTAAYADGQKVVTLGADLSEEQKAAILKYFGVSGQNIETLYITNQDERDHLASYVPIEQIGTRTFSCALVNPTTSGGIRVKTANLNWVTSNMIASTLSTSGVVNCEVLAASPFEVSGTGALTGIIMAYETASGETLEIEKKEIATQELITTGTIANEIGQTQATNIVNEIKIQVIENHITEQDQVIEIVNNVLDEHLESKEELSDEDRDLLADLAERIAEQEYDFEEMRETLERVEENVSELSDEVTGIAGAVDEVKEAASSDTAASYTTSEKLDEDSILLNTDDTALGGDVIIDSTDEEALPEATKSATEEVSPEPAPADTGFEIVSEDSYEDGAAPDQNVPQEQANEQTAEPEPAPEPAPVPVEAGAEEEASPVDITDEGGFADDEGWEVFDGGESGDSGELQDTPSAEVNPEENQEEWADTQDEAANEDNSDAFNWDDDQDAYTDEGDAEAGEDQDEWSFPEDENAEDDFFAEEPSDDENMDESADSFEISDSALEAADADADGAAGSTMLKLLVDQANVVPVSGTVSITDNYGGYEQVDLSDASHVAATEMTDDELSEKGWIEGTRILIILDNGFEPNASYDVTLEGTFAQTDDASQTDSAPTTDLSESTTFYTGSYGAALQISSIYDLRAESTITASLIYEEGAAYADVYSDDPSIASINPEEYDLMNGDGTFTIYYASEGDTDLYITFYDSEYNELGSAHLPITVIG